LPLVRLRRWTGQTGRGGTSIRRSAILLALALALATFVALPQPVAQAALNDGYCDINEVCVYKDVNLGIPRSDFQYYYADCGGCPDCHTYNYPSSCNTYKSATCLLNDSVSSMDSWDRRYKVRFFTDRYYDGLYETVVEYGPCNVCAI